MIALTIRSVLPSCPIPPELKPIIFMIHLNYKKAEAACLLLLQMLMLGKCLVKYKEVINSEYYHRHYNGYYCLQAHIYWLDLLVYYHAHGIENNTSRYSRDDR